MSIGLDFVEKIVERGIQGLVQERGMQGWVQHGLSVFHRPARGRAISNLENGKANVSLFTLRRLAKVLKVKVADLVADE